MITATTTPPLPYPTPTPRHPTRTQLLGLMKQQLTEGKQKKLTPAALAELEASVVPLFACIEDRNADVRKAANEALLPVMTHLGYNRMSKKLTSVKVCTAPLVTLVTVVVSSSTLHSHRVITFNE